MAFFVDQQSNFKHFCKICKKGFGCGRALGGHMRAHGIGDESGHIEEDYSSSDWEDKLGGNSVPPTNKRMYALRTNPNRLKSCRVCENCGKEFLSWKSFLEHGKCSSANAESHLSSLGSDGYEDEDDDGNDTTRRGNCNGWSKRRRSLRGKVGKNNNVNFNSSNCPSSEEEDLANCLMMLSNATVDPFLITTEPEESCASASKEEERRNNTIMNNFIAPIACRVTMEKAKGVAKGLFECKACKKVFNSHQALGGHRASHKKVKGCFAARLDHMDESQADDQDHDVITHEEFFPTNNKSNSTLVQFDHGNSSTPLVAAAAATTSKRKSNVHECSICHRVFSSGQALGGHKRCHWITSNAPDTINSSLLKFHQFQDHQIEQIQKRPKFNNVYSNSNQQQELDLKLDLNLPAPPADDRARRSNNQSSLDVVSTEIYLQPWLNVDSKEKQDNQHHQVVLQVVDTDHVNKDKNNNCNANISMQNVDDEAYSKVKLAKLSELKDINVSGGGSSSWLQVGIGSTTNVGSDT